MTYYSNKDLARSFRTVRANTMELANDIPEEQYEFRATPETRTVAAVLKHVAAGSRWQLKFHGEQRPSVTMEDFGGYMREAADYEATLVTKADIVNALELNGEQFATWVDSIGESTLAEVVAFPPPIQPPTKSRFEMILGVKEHEMHHRGQLMVMQRLLGIVPHLTRAREARVAAQR